MGLPVKNAALRALSLFCTRSEARVFFRELSNLADSQLSDQRNKSKSRVALSLVSTLGYGSVFPLLGPERDVIEETQKACL